MSNPCWRDSLRPILRQTMPGDVRPRIAIVGVGHDLRGDDGAGVGVVRRLQAALHPRDDLLLIDAGPAPENCTGAIRQFDADVVLLVDAVHLDQLPGSVHLLNPHHAGGCSATTHTLPLDLLARFLEDEMGCTVYLLGIQPQTIDIDQPLSLPVRRSVNKIADCIEQMIQPAVAVKNR